MEIQKNKEQTIKNIPTIPYYLEINNREIALTHLQRYDIITTGGRMPIQWKKVETIANKKLGAQNNTLPEPYNEIQYKNEGDILGEIIKIHNAEK